MAGKLIQGVVFDAGDILFDASLWRRWLTGRLQQLGVDVDYPQLVRRWESLLVDVYCGRAAYWDRFARLLTELGLPNARHQEVCDAAREKGRELQIGRLPFDGVAETLATLRAAGLKLAVLSDTEGGQAGVRKMLRSLGIEDYFDAVVASNEIGHAKPEREAFQAAADAIGLPLGRLAFVGHDIDELTGAQAVGMTAVAFNYAAGAPADHYVQAFGDIRRLLVGGTS